MDFTDCYNNKKLKGLKMAINKVPINGSTVKLKAVGGANTEAEIECIKGDLTIDFGTYTADKSICHKSGVNYDKSSTADFEVMTVETWWDGDKADAFQTLLFQAHQGTGDFDMSVAGNSEKATIAFEFADADNTVITAECMILNVKALYTLNGKLGMTFTAQQTKTPVVT